MTKVLIPEVISNGVQDTLPAVRTGLLARLRGTQSTALQRVEQGKVLKIANVQAAGEILKAEAVVTAEHQLFEYQLAQSVAISKHRLDVNAMVAKYRDDLKGMRERIIAKMVSEAILDMEVEGFINELEELNLPPLQEAQHRMRARKTARREKAQQRKRHFHHH